MAGATEPNGRVLDVVAIRAMGLLHAQVGSAFTLKAKPTKWKVCKAYPRPRRIKVKAQAVGYETEVLKLRVKR